MKKKTLLGIALAVGAVLLIAVAVWGRQYYTDRYVGSDYYAMVPLGYDVTPEALMDSNGNAVDTGKRYELTAYDAQGEAKEVRFTVRGGDADQMPQPGTFLLVKASKQLVVGWSVIEESEVPEKALRGYGRALSSQM
jgi:uncharacterized protein (TIGR01655 family)